MADNKPVLDGTASSFTMAMKDLSSVFYPKHILYDDAGNPLEGAFGSGYVQLVPSVNTDAHTSGDVIAATEVLAAICRGNDVTGILSGMTCARLDSATGIDIRVWVLKANSSIGTESSGIGIADGDMDDILGWVDFAAGDFVSGGSTNCIAQKRNINMTLVPASGTDDVYIAISATGSVDLTNTTDIVLAFHRI